MFWKNHKNQGRKCYWCCEVRRPSPFKNKKLVNGKIRNFNKTLKEIPEGERQDLRPVAYIRNGSIYACRRDMLVRGKRYGTQNSLAYIMDDNNSVNIDTKRDLLLAKILLKNKK